MPLARALETCHIRPISPCVPDKKRGLDYVPVPKSYYQLGHVAKRISVRPGEAKVGHLNLATIVHEKVASLEISVNDPVVVTKSNSGEKLKEEGFDFGGEERSWHSREKGFEIVLDKVHDDEDPAHYSKEISKKKNPKEREAH